MINSNKDSIESETIVDFLKRNLQLKEIHHKILHQQIIHRKAKEMNLVVTPEEIQSVAEHQRREKRLEKAADTYAWLAEQMISSDDWESGIYDYLLVKKLAKAIFADEVEKFFNQNKLNFDQVLLYQMIIPYQKLASEVF
ncbi:MAG: peptidylprolyl isomerase, partial [Cyanobacteria bacterium P01_G01_bin.49]